MRQSELPNRKRTRRRRRHDGGYSTRALVASAFAGATIFAALSSAVFARATISADTFRQLDLFGEVFEQVHENYVSNPDDSDLIKGAIDGMLSTLDPHSNYLSAEDFQTMQEQTRGSFAGLGIQVTMDNEGPDKGVVKIVAPIDDTPADRAGLQTNDLIVEIDDKKVLGMSIDEAISNLKGEKGTKVTVKIVRDREAEPFDVTLTRDIVTVQSVTHRIEGEFGYVRIATFSEQTKDGINKAIKKLNKEIPGGMKGMIIDVRSNPGGLLDQAVAVSDMFLEGGEIVSTRGRRPRDTMREMGTPGDKLNGKPIVVLINGGSASASEIVAGALQDRNRALLLGTKSFGKGSVQTVIPLQNGLQGALRLTTSRYYTPSGRSIQALGIEPDINMPVIYPGQDEAAVNRRRSEADLPGALDVKDGEEPLDSEAENAPPKADPASSENTPSSNDGDDADKVSTDETAPVQCGYEEDGETVNDCQLERALEILADVTTYRQFLADAGTARAAQ